MAQVVYFGVPTSWSTEQPGKRADGTTPNPRVRVTFALSHKRIDDGDWQQLVEGEPHVCDMLIILTQNAFGRQMAKKRLEALGFNDEFGDGMSFAAAETGCELVLGSRQGNDGKTYTQWDLHGISMPEIKKFTADKVMEMNSWYRAEKQAEEAAKAASSKPAKPVKPKAPQTPPAPFTAPNPTESAKVPFDALTE